MDASGLLPQRLAFWALFPFVAVQGLWVGFRARRFPDAAGPESGSVGSGQEIRLLGIGDSIVAGVGAATLEEALVGRFAEALARRRGARVLWQAVGQTGARAGGVRSRLVGKLPAVDYDLILVSVGVNDVTGLVRSRRWADDIRELMDALRAHSPNAAILMTGVPPLGGFPSLPQPLRFALGIRARILDRLLQRATASRERCFHLPIDLEPTPERFSGDGYHPSADTYRLWGERIAEWVVGHGSV